MKAIIIVATLATVLSSCGQFGEKNKKPEGIVCCSKQLTEIMYALHLGDTIAGLDLTSTYPPETKDVTRVGYHRHLSAEGIISLHPTVVIHQGDVAPPTVMPQLEKVGIPIKVYPAGSTIDSTKYLIRLVAKEFGQDTAAERIIKKMDADIAGEADAIVKKYPTKPRVLIIHFGQQRNQYFIMGTRGTADAMLKLAGGINAADTSSFRDLSPEVILRSQPDVILATDFGYDKAGSKENFMKLPGIELTPAAKNGKIYRIEEHDLVYFGPRTGENVLLIAKLIHQ